MAGRSSLTEGLDSIGRAKAPSQGRKGGDTWKLLAALGLFLVAGAILGVYYDVIPLGSSSRKKLPELTPEQQKQVEESRQIQERELKRPDVQTGGA